MFTIKGCLEVAVLPTGFVRNASTSKRLSLLANVNDATAASCFPANNSAFRSVSFRAAALGPLR